MRCCLRVVLLGALLLAATGACRSKPSAAPILLSCTGADATEEVVVDAICDALAAEIAARAPERPLYRSPHDDARSPGAWEGVLEVVRTRTNVWEGRLRWRVIGEEADAGRKAGPFVKITSIDAPLGSGAYRRFARGVLKAGQAKF